MDGDGRTFAGMGVDFADYDNDGWPDLVVTTLANQKYALYHNEHDGTFDYASYKTGFARMTLLHSGWSALWFDYDNDGWKDLLIAQGHDLDTVEKSYPQLHYREPMMLVRNAAGKLTDVTASSGPGLQEPWVGRGMAIGDLDNDGRVDAVVTTNGGTPHILHNETPTANHWVTLKLVGHKSNRDGIGALIQVTTPAGSQWETVSTSRGYLSSSDPRAHFGLGSSAVAQAIEIRWPSGIVQTLKNVAGDQVISIDEGRPLAHSISNAEP